MSQVSCGKFDLRAPLVHGVFEVRERATQRCVALCRVGHHHGQAWTEEARVDPGEEEGQAQPGLGDPIAMGPRDPLWRGSRSVIWSRSTWTTARNGWTWRAPGRRSIGFI